MIQNKADDEEWVQFSAVVNIAPVFPPEPPVINYKIFTPAEEDTGSSYTKNHFKILTRINSFKILSTNSYYF